MNVSSPCSWKARQALTGHSNWSDSSLEVLDDGSRQGDRILFTKLGPELGEAQSLNTRFSFWGPGNAAATTALPKESWQMGTITFASKKKAGQSFRSLGQLVTMSWCTML